MSAPRAKVFSFSVSIDEEGRASVSGGPPRELPAEMTPEDLVLLGLARCSLASLAYHARRSGRQLRLQKAEATGTVTRRDQDGRYAFVDIECRLQVSLEPPLAAEETAALLAKAERDCFVGASLAVPPRYQWRVDGAAVAPSQP